MNPSVKEAMSVLAALPPDFSGTVQLTVRVATNQHTAQHRATPAAPSASKISLAIAVLTEHPDWKNEQIAAVAGCHVITLSKSRRFRQARQVIKESGKHGRRSEEEEDD